MRTPQVRANLRKAYDKIAQELKGLPGLTISGGFKPRKTDTDGQVVIVADCGGGIDVEIWLDKAAGGDSHRFWIGFGSRSAQKMKIFLLSLSMDLAPKNFSIPYRQRDWKKGSGSVWKYKRPSATTLSRPYYEAYPTWGTFYFGMYYWGDRVGSNQVVPNLWQAAQFVRTVLRTVRSADDEEAKAFEGELRRRFIFYRSRERSLRDRKIKEALELNDGRLKCEVPRCEFDFYERYGTKGKRYAQVHHKKQLAALPKRGSHVTTKDLAVVCANCHAMIHLGGKCRPLQTLISKNLTRR